MKYSNFRLFLWICLFIVSFLLFNFWYLENEDNKILNNEKTSSSVSTIDEIIQYDSLQNNDKIYSDDKIINITTDVIRLSIDLYGGDIIYLSLLKYPQSLSNIDKGYELLDIKNRSYIAQSGLLSDIGPDSYIHGRQTYTSDKFDYILDVNQDFLEVFLYCTLDNVNIIKKFIFKRNSYLFDVEYIVNNNSDNVYFGNIYARLKNKGNVESSLINASRSYIGAAVNTVEKSYKKISFDDIKKKNFHQNMLGGWMAMIERYFFSAWIPDNDFEYNYLTEKMETDNCSIRFIKKNSIVVLPGEEKNVKISFFGGPEVSEMLKNIAPGLELSVDYGILWPIAQPIFLLLRSVNDFVNNWGISIIIVTLIIKLLFYRLSVASYRSMGNMRKLQPKINILKERYSDDKTKFGYAIMDLYKKEKINPLGGCLPIFIQIPVFISLYYVLLESIDLRQANFFLWIVDLSEKDPYYILPIIMGFTMYLQQKLSPAPPDPLQAKIMMFLPLFFTFLFLQFPSGLVLYWIVNNVLSISQQWYIMKKIDGS